MIERESGESAEIFGGIQLAKARAAAGHVVGENVTDDQRLVLCASSGGMGCSSQAWRLQALADYGLGPEVFDTAVGLSGGALVLAAFLAGQLEIGIEMFPYLAQQTDFVNPMLIRLDPDKQQDRAPMDLSMLQALITEDERFALNTQAVCDSDTELLFSTAHPDSLSNIIRGTKRSPKVGPDDLIPEMMKGASMPILGPVPENGELDGATWNSDIVSHWNQAAEEAGQTPEEDNRTHVVVMESSKIALRLRNLFVSPLVARWLQRRSDGLSMKDTYTRFVRGQAEVTGNALMARLTGRYVARAASVQVLRPEKFGPYNITRQRETFERKGRAVRQEMLQVLDDPDSHVTTYTTTRQHPSAAQAAAAAISGYR